MAQLPRSAATGEFPLPSCRNSAIIFLRVCCECLFLSFFGVGVPMNRVSRVPVFDRRVARRSIAFALDWQKSLGSRDDVVRAFEELRSLVSARSVLHVRQSRGSRDAVSAVRDDPTAGKVFSRPTRSYTSLVLGENLHVAKPGKVWFISDVDVDDETRDRLRIAEIVDLAVVPLENGPAHSDFLELEFLARVPQHDRMLLETLCPLVAKTWQERKPGSVATMMAGRPSRVARERPLTEAKSILDADNPAGLTRSEFRVCVLIHDGMLPEDIAKKLNVTKSTLRSHMCSIYSKTDVSGHVELIHRLHGAAASGSNRA